MHSRVRTYSSDKSLVQARRMQIIQGATRLFVKKGYDRTSVREVAKACKMSMGALYHYVGSKEDILLLIIDQSMSDLAKSIEEFSQTIAALSPPEALCKFIDMYYRMVDKNQDITLFTYQETKNLEQRARRQVLDSAARDVGACEALLRRGIASGDFDIGNPTVMAHNIIVGAHMWAVRRWFLKERVTLDEYIREQTKYVLKAIMAKDKVSGKGDVKP